MSEYIILAISSMFLGAVIILGVSLKFALAEVDATLARLAATLEESTDRSNQIAATAAQEAAGVAQIAMAMSNVADGGASSAAAARQLEDAIRSVNHVTEDLQRFVAG
jgi:methyl-accepting chemotaxis protein